MFRSANLSKNQETKSDEKSINDDRADDFSLALFFQIFSHLSEVDNPLKPFVIINYLVNNCLDIFIKSSLKVYSSEAEAQPEFFDQNFTTVCINTVKAIVLIFLGEEAARKNIQSIILQSSISSIVTLPSGSKWEYKIEELFSGDIVHGIHHDPEFSNSNEIKNEKIKQYISKNCNNFFNYNSGAIHNILHADHSKSEEQIIEELSAYFENIDYAFNEIILSDLTNEIFNNEIKINNDKSIIYCVGIVEKRTEKTLTYEHIFMVEQFWYNKNKSVCYRIYQSWLNKATLLDDIKNNTFYDELGEVALDKKLMLRFLAELSNLYCEKYSSETYESTFGYAPLQHNHA